MGLVKQSVYLVKALQDEINALPVDAVVVLLQSNWTPDPALVWSTLNESTFGGYARVPLSWVGVVTDPGSAGNAFIDGNIAVFVCTGSPQPQSIYGYAVISPSAPQPLLWSELIMGGPVTINAGQAYAVQPTMRLQSIP